MSMPAPGAPLGPQRPAAKMSDTTMMAIVFVGAAIGGFLVWPMIRPMFIARGQQQQAVSYTQEGRGGYGQQSDGRDYGRRRGFSPQGYGQQGEGDFEQSFGGFSQRGGRR